jgi:SAM-dependent methyltransferase
VSEVQPETQLWNLLRGAMGTKAFAIAAELEIADSLAAGPRPVAELAQEAGADERTLHRILRALASDGVFAEEGPGVFRNTEASELLRKDQPGSWPEFAHLFGAVFYEATATMDPSSGDETFPRVFGTDFWSWLEQHPAERSTFDAAMAGGKERNAARLAELEWRGDETVVDVGGGNGALLNALLELRPELRGIVFDLSETDRDESSFGDRVTFVAGDFFEEVPPGDVYVLSAILHDWDDDRATAILKTIRRAAPPDGRLLATESVIPEGNEPHGAKWLDLLMLVLGGRERDEADWRALLEGAGFRPDRIEDGLIQATCR